MPNEFIIFDTEYTAWEGSRERDWSGKDEYREIVQIGAVRVKNMEEVDSFMMYVKPTINPQLSEYFINLTGITQEDVNENGVSFQEALSLFNDWSCGLPMYCYGHDEIVIEKNAELIEADVPFLPDRFNNVKNTFQSAGIDADQYHSGTIPKAFNLAPPPSAHDALNDARSILVALKAAQERGMLN